MIYGTSLAFPSKAYGTDRKTTVDPGVNTNYK